jgi:hypothetical protein
LTSCSRGTLLKSWQTRTKRYSGRANSRPSSLTSACLDLILAQIYSRQMRLNWHTKCDHDRRRSCVPLESVRAPHAGLTLHHWHCNVTPWHSAIALPPVRRAGAVTDSVMREAVCYFALDFMQISEPMQLPRWLFPNPVPFPVHRRMHSIPVCFGQLTPSFGCFCGHSDQIRALMMAVLLGFYRQHCTRL